MINKGDNVKININTINKDDLSIREVEYINNHGDNIYKVIDIDKSVNEYGIFIILDGLQTGFNEDELILVK